MGLEDLNVLKTDTEEDLDDFSNPDFVRNVFLRNLQVVMREKTEIDLLAEVEEVVRIDSKFWRLLAAIYNKTEVAPHMLFDASFRFYYNLPSAENCS